MSLNWNHEWITPYESPWSIIEKIKHANKISTRDFLRVFGSKEVSKISSGFIGKRNRDLWSFFGVDDNHFSQELGFSLKERSENLLLQISSKLPRHISLKKMFREELYFCIECIKSGYHSIFHQFILLDNCPFHGNALHKGCWNCGEKIEYAMPSHNLEEGFFCTCGECLSPEFHYESTLAYSEIKDQLLSTFLNSNNNLDNDNTYIFQSCIGNNGDILKHLIKMHDIEDINLKYKVRGLKESSNNYYDEIYECIRQVIKSFETRLFKTVLKNHIHCIKRFTNLIKRRGEAFPEICPYAYAYVFWRDSFLNLNPFYNELGPIRKNNLRSLEIPVYAYQDDIKHVINYLMNNKKYIFESLAWIIGHLVFILANFHFNKWLNLAGQYAEKKIRPVQRYNEILEDIPFFAFGVRKDKIFLHLENDIKLEFEYGCPYSDNYYKTFHEDEFSFLPMRLAINSASKEEKISAEKYLAQLKIVSTIR